MAQDEAKELLLKLLSLADRMEQRDARVISELRQSVDALQRTANGLGSNGEQLTRQISSAIVTQTGQALREGVGPSMQVFNAEMSAASGKAQRAAHEVQAAAGDLNKQRGLWLWAVPLSLVLASVLAAGGSSYVVWRNHQALQRAEFSQSLLNAVNSGALTQCGKQLCARIGKDARRAGAANDYAEVR